MITLGNTDSNRTFDDVFNEIEVRGVKGWEEVTQGEEDWCPDKKTLGFMYDSGMLKIITIHKEGVLCGHIIYMKNRKLFNMSQANLMVLSIYIYEEFRQYNIFARILKYLKRQAKKEGYASVILDIPAYKRTADKLIRQLGMPNDYLYQIKVR